MTYETARSRLASMLFASASIHLLSLSLMRKRLQRLLRKAHTHTHTQPCATANTCTALSNWPPTSHPGKRPHPLRLRRRHFRSMCTCACRRVSLSVAMTIVSVRHKAGMDELVERGAQGLQTVTFVSLTTVCPPSSEAYSVSSVCFLMTHSLSRPNDVCS